jgi:hypothetical protein
MNKDQHTPGPWAIARCGENDPKPCGIYSEGIATGMVCSIGTQHESAQANARLIASAPDLLAALRAIAGMKCDGDLWHGNEDGENVTNDETHDALVNALCIAREAIAQMEGAQ